jgi:hypothetical protein
VTSFTFGEEVEVIPPSACSGMTNLTSITIPNSVTSIGSSAFQGCTGLTSVTIGNSVTSIGQGAFAGCSGLTSVTVNSNSVIRNNLKDIFGSQVTQYIIGSDITSIPNTISKGYSNLTSIVVESGNSTYDSRNDCNAIIETATNSLISGCKNTVIPNSVTNIGGSAFYNCTGLTSVTIPNSVTSIGDYAFSHCSWLTSIEIPNSVTSIGFSAFSYCSRLTSVTIGDSVTSIGSYAFAYCLSLTSIEIPNSVTSIGGNSFFYCRSLTSVVWNAKNCSNSGNFGSQVTSFTFGEEVEVIPASICAGMTNLTSITIPSSVTSIGNYAFEDCTGLTSIEIPNSVTSIGNYAFEDCTGLTSVTCLATTPPVMVYNVFNGVNCSNIPLYVPMESVSLYQAANDWKEFNIIGIMLADEVETAVFAATPTDDFGVILEWQAVENAILYNIDIIQGNDTIRKLQFDSNGKLLNSPSNAPSRYSNIRYTSTAGHSGNGWRYELNDLDPGTNYTYSITIKAENGSVLYTQSIGFTTKEETFIIKFVNWNGEELLVLPEVVKGTTPSYTGETPVRPNTAEYTYTFAGWTPNVVAVTCNATYRATFNGEVNMYSITTSAINGEVEGAGIYAYGTEIEIKAIPAEGYTFDQWSDEVTDNPRTITVTGDVEYTALFKLAEGFENIYTSEPVQKVIIDQKVYILRDGNVYDLIGRKL